MVTEAREEARRMAKQSGTVNVDFGGYNLSAPTSGAIDRFASDVALTVETLLLLAGGADLDSSEDGFKAAGELLGWARECQAFHGIEADKGEGRDR
jgi:hypothetical protein